MFKVEYVYAPLFGNSYVAMDYCVALDVCENDSNMTLVLTHGAKDLNGKEVLFKSNIIVPRQRISVSMLEN
jgi:hypothetical protein